MFYQPKLDILRYQRKLLPGFETLCRIHDTVDVPVRIISVVHRHHSSGVLVTLYVTEQCGASNIILAALSPLKDAQERLLALMSIPYQQIDQERRRVYRGDGIFLGTKPKAVQSVLFHLENGYHDEELDELQQSAMHPILESMCCAVGSSPVSNVI